MTKKKKKSRNWIIISLLLIIGILAAIAFFKAKNKPKGIEVTVEKVEKRSILETVSASGRVFPEKEIKISSDVSGEIVELFVKEGDSVRVGQVLAKIDPESYVSAVDRGIAALNSSKSQSAMSRSQIESAKAQKEQINAQLENARSVHKRNEQLLKDGVISQLDFEQSESNLNALIANYKASEASLKSAEESTKGSEFAIKSAEANLKELRTNLNRTTIKAPASGIVSSLSVEQGERVVGTIQMAGTEMMRIANLNSMEVQVDVSENDILRVSMTDNVSVEVDAYLDRKFKGTVTEIANSASNISGAAATLNTDQVTNFVVKVRLDPDSYKDLTSDINPYPFRPGMSATVDIETEKTDDIISVPIQCVTTRERKSEDGKKKKSSIDELDEVVFLQEADTVRMVVVSTGIQDDDFIQINAGLEEGQTVVSGPYSAVSKKLKEGEQIRIKEEDNEDEEKD